MRGHCRRSRQATATTRVPQGSTAPESMPHEGQHSAGKATNGQASHQAFATVATCNGQHTRYEPRKRTPTTTACRAWRAGDERHGAKSTLPERKGFDERVSVVWFRDTVFSLEVGFCCKRCCRSVAFCVGGVVSCWSRRPSCVGCAVDDTWQRVLRAPVLMPVHADRHLP